MSNTNKVRYTTLPARIRTVAMNEVRDYADKEVAKQESALEGITAEDLKMAESGMASDYHALELGRRTKDIEYKLLKAKEFFDMAYDDIALINFLNKDTLLFSQTGQLHDSSVCTSENPVLEFDQYCGEWYNKYTAQSKDKSYTLLKMHGDSTFLMSIRDNEGELVEPQREVGSVGFGFKLCQDHHTAHLDKKRETEEA